MEGALIDVWFSLLGLSYSLANIFKETFFSCTVDFNQIGVMSGPGQSKCDYNLYDK